MKSNFLALQKINQSLFDVAYSAEQLFVNRQYQYVPTALRVFTEGIIKDIISYTTFGNDLAHYEKQFSIEYPNHDHISSASRNIRLKGNKTSHYEPTLFGYHDLVKLFKDAINLQNFYIVDHLKQSSTPSQFVFANLPEPTVRVIGEEKLRIIDRQPDVNKDLLAQVKRYETELFELKNERDTFQKVIKRTNQKSESYRKEKESLASQILELEATRDDEIHRIKQDSLKHGELKLKQLIEEQSQSFESKVSNLNLKIQSLTTDNEHLEYEIKIFEHKLKENQLAQKSQDPVKENLLKEIDKSLKRDIIESYPEQLKLDEYQQELVNIHDGKHYLIAPPGAGKTAVLTNRLEYALSRYDDNEMTCLTFTTKAAKEMQNRAAIFLGERKPFIGNFHTLCLDIYRNSKDLSILNRFSSILPDVYRNEFFERAYKKASTEIKAVKDLELPDAYVSLIQQYTNDLGDGFKHDQRTRFDRYTFFKLYPYLWLLHCDCTSLHEFAKAQLKDLLISAIIACHKSMYGSHQAIDVLQGGKCLWKILCSFIDLKQSVRAIDYDDALCFGLLTLINKPQPKRFLQVDEVQDLNPIQWKIIDALIDDETHLFVVGDKEQSIYGFLGANVESLDSETSGFSKHYLMNNYRSDKQIVSLLNQYRNVMWGLPAINSELDRSVDMATMLLSYNTQIDEFIGIQQAVKKILLDKTRSVGLLLSTNKAVDNFSAYFDQVGIRYFRVSSKDLMQQEIIQDWLSLIKAHKGTANNVDWYNLVYRFTRDSFKQNNITHYKAMNFVDALTSQGVSIGDVISDNPNNSDLYNYRLKFLVDSWQQKDVVIFDTETTGIDFDTSKIIQIAAVRVREGKVLDIFDQYINIGLDDGDQKLNQAFEESAEIHKITREQLAQGGCEQNVLTDFFDFVGSSPLIAHNMNFDNTMLRMGVMGQNDYNLECRFHETTAFAQFDTLLLARTILPDESSYKLEALLEKYQLDGVNSHNALDDVKATSSLLTFLISKIKPKLEIIDNIIDENTAIIYTVNQQFQQANRFVRSYYASGSKVKLSEILIEWVDYALAQNNWYSDNDPISIKADIKNKLVDWLDDNNYVGHIHELFNDLDPKTQVLFTLKESDLINPNKDKLIISTIHRAKGLEFDTVIIPQVTTRNYPGWLPDDVSDSERQTNEEEKQRLLYVAMSRPVNKLIMSYHRNGTAGSYSYTTDLYEPITKCKDYFKFIR